MLRLDAGSNDRQVAYGKLSLDGVPVEGAQVYCMVHYPEGDVRWPEDGFTMTDSDGVAPITFLVGHTQERSAVYIDVYFVHQEKVIRARTSYVQV